MQQLKHLDFSIVEKALLGQQSSDIYMDTSTSAENEFKNYKDVISHNQHSLLEVEKLHKSNIVMNNNTSIDSVDSIGIASYHHKNPIHFVQNQSICSDEDNTSTYMPNKYDTNKMISLTKSKEYNKLASHVPSIYQIHNGKKVLNQNDLAISGINAVNSKHEKYQQNVIELRKKNAREILERNQKQSSTIDHFPRNFKNEVLSRKSVANS